METLIKVRGLLGEKPLPARWLDVRKWLDQCDVDERNEIIIPYCREHMEHDPAWFKLRRSAPKEWIKSLFEEEEIDPRLTLVSHLKLSQYDAEKDVVLKRLSDLSAFPLLRSLHLDTFELTDEDIETLLAFESLEQLEVLAICNNHITASGVELLASSSRLAQLQYLNLQGNQYIGEAGIVAIAQSPHFASLRFLDLSHCELSTDGKAAQAIAESTTLSPSAKAGWNR